MKVGNHPKVWQYDGAFKCYACGQSWGAVIGNPPMPEKCERKERRKKDRRAKEQPGDDGYAAAHPKALNEEQPGEQAGYEAAGQVCTQGPQEGKEHQDSRVPDRSAHD